MTGEFHPKLKQIKLSHCFSAITSLFSMLAKCDHIESCTGKLAPISPKGLKFVAQTDFGVHR